MQKLPGKYRLFFQIACLLLCGSLSAQVQDSIAPPDLLPRTDTLRSTDSATVDLSRLKISNDALDDVVEYAAEDSMWFDVKNKQVHLYGKASVKYTTLNITAGYILLDYGNNELSAQQFPDSTGQLSGLPDFKDGEQQFTANRLRYNFKTKKGIIYEARTQQEDLYVLGERAKFIGAETADTTQKARNTIYNQDAIITTCDHPKPHFGIRTKKLKVIQDKLIVTGLSNLEVGGIPTPLVIPFGFFPVTKTRKAGLIIPKDFDFRTQEGFGFEGFGWYQPISEHMDATVLFRAFTGGTWGVTATSRYNYRYRNNGNFELRYNNRVVEDARANKVPNKSFALQWTHNQDPKAHPSRRFSGSVNIQTNRDAQRNQNDFGSVFTNTLSSNLSYSKTFPGKPYQYSIGLRHSQNTQTRQMDITLPSAQFNMQRIYPLKRKVQVGKERWYEKLSFTYTGKLDNSIRTADTLLFERETLENARMGIQHQFSTDYVIKIFKYINLTPNVRYEENWYPYTINKTLLDSTVLVYDTTFQNGEILEIKLNENKSKFGFVETTRNWGFYAFRTYNLGLSASTSLFLTQQSKRKKTWYQGIRHKVTPTLSTGLAPDFSKQQDRYFKTYYTDLRPAKRDTLSYGIFEQSIYSQPTLSKREVSIGYSIANVLEFKYFSAKKDTVLKKRIFDNLTFSGDFKPGADSLRWSTVGTGGLFRLFKGLSNLTWNATFDPYIADSMGRRIDRTTLKERGTLVRTTQLGFALNTGFQVKQIRDLFNKKRNADAPASSGPKLPKDDLLSLFDNFRISHRISFARQLIPTGVGTARDTFTIGAHTLDFSGSIPLSSKWSLDIDNISYNFNSNALVYPSFGFTRDLHCWQLSFRWQPDRGTYEFFLGVKPGTLDFVKVPYRQTIFDVQR
ncbi:MAG: putative LPS assembly protein LptD [Saprospiraceae bacterium]|nr:putative LPS assembly protein LptD [Saprospiraceae bacterium]